MSRHVSGPNPESQAHRGRRSVASAFVAPALALSATLTLTPRPAAGVATSIILVGSLRAILARHCAERLPIDDLRPLEHELARWRRRDETATILVVAASAEHSTRLLARSLRKTDVVALVSSIRGPRLVAALDDHSLDRRRLEDRLAALGPGRPRLGWASFPADGTTLEALIATASAAPELQAGRTPGPRDRRAWTPRWGGAAQPSAEPTGVLTQLESVK
jgi:hypothetical protein